MKREWGRRRYKPEEISFESPATTLDCHIAIRRRRGQLRVRNAHQVVCGMKLITKYHRSSSPPNVNFLRSAVLTLLARFIFSSCRTRDNQPSLHQWRQKALNLAHHQSLRSVSSTFEFDWRLRRSKKANTQPSCHSPICTSIFELQFHPPGKCPLAALPRLCIRNFSQYFLLPHHTSTFP